ncbi:MAG: basic amino acid/polyamine antiporter, APA family [Parcubacteria group bacterium Gr01-1014_3]|nr:MAG: basic amino acid/polyamine antiporter, APA family [Parcubacteria group bacterium Gr01-1014_3]
MTKTIKNFFLATGLLVSTIIGAGVFALPYVFQNSSFKLGFFYLALAALVYTIIHRMYAEIIFSSKAEHRFVGFSEKYFGKGGFWLAILIAVVEIFLVLTIYLILSVSFANLLFPGIADWLKVVIFWLFGSAIIFIGLRRLASIEFIIAILILAIIILVHYLGFARLNEFSFLSSGSLGLLAPIAPILFALSGRVGLHAVADLFRGEKEPLKKASLAISLGTIIPAVVYGLFVIGMIGLTPIASEDSITGLSASLPADGRVPNWLALTIGVLGIISLLSSYVAAGFDIKHVLKTDLKFPSWLMVLAVLGVPLGLYFANLSSFLGLISLVGGILLSIEGIMIALMWQKLKGRFSPLAWALVSVFSVVLIHQIVSRL